MKAPNRSEATRRSLCLAAEGLVATQGLSNVTLRSVALAAGQRNTAAVSYHFGNLPLLLRTVVEMRLAETEAERIRMIAAAGGVGALDAFAAWRCLARPLLALEGERVPHAHIRFLMHMGTGGLLSDPFDARISHPGAASIALLLERLHGLLADLPPMIGRARVSLGGMMFMNAVALHDGGTLGPGTEAVTLEVLLEDVEQQVRRILTA